MTKTQVIEKINTAADRFDTLSGPQKELLAYILSEFNADTQPKTIQENDKTLVWCNYHQQYEPASEFATRTDKKGQIKYKASCREGMHEISKAKRLRNTIDHKIVWGLRNGKLTADEVTELLNDFDKVTNDYEALREFHNEVLGSKMQVTTIK